MADKKIAIILKSPDFCESVTEDIVIYADAALNHKNKVGKKEILAVVGDFDSLGYTPKSVNIVGLNVEKDFTDGERAIHLAVENGYKNITIYGAYGGKIEHILGNIALLKIAKNLGAKAVIQHGDYVTELINNSIVLNVEKGSTLSIIPYGERCEFIKSSGLYYPLDNLVLTNADTRGISNQTTENEVRIEIKKGEALVIYGRK
ncbi:MAG: thiamine diphosphokinase [Clostridiales bacterium]|nr:thiamine diphosphokinase [Clostridiales bacterium]